MNRHPATPESMPTERTPRAAAHRSEPHADEPPLEPRPGQPTVERRRGPRRAAHAEGAGPDAAHPSPPVALRRAARPVGRPRSGTADRAILDAAMELLAEVGLAGLTMSAVVSRSRVARATVYRRYPNREALLSAALAQVKGREPFPLTGNVADDIATSATWAAAVVGEAPFRRFLPLFVTEALRGPAAARSVTARVAPNHGGMAEEYREHAAASGLRTDIDPALVADIVQGTMMMRLLSTGLAPDKDLVDQLVDVLFQGLRVPPRG